MINSVKSFTSRLPGATSSRKPDSGSFAEQLIGADRNERKEKPGREKSVANTNHEGTRSVEGDSKSGVASAKIEERLDRSAMPPKSGTVRHSEVKPEARRKTKSTSTEQTDVHDSILSKNIQRSIEFEAKAAPKNAKNFDAESEESRLNPGTVKSESSGSAMAPGATDSKFPQGGNQRAEVDVSGKMQTASSSESSEPREEDFAKPDLEDSQQFPEIAPQSTQVDGVGERKKNLTIEKMSSDGSNALEVARRQQGQVHRRALEDFMNNMDKEFGIPPEKIVDAFSKMDEKTLMAPPEDSTKEFLGNLEIPVQQQARVGDLFKQMVRATGETALNEKMTGIDQGLSLDVLSPRDQALQQLNQAIDQLNDSFAMRGQSASQMSVPLDNSLKAQLAAEQMSAQLRQLQGQDPQQRKDRAAGDEALAEMSGAYGVGALASDTLADSSASATISPMAMSASPAQAFSAEMSGSSNSTFGEANFNQAKTANIKTSNGSASKASAAMTSSESRVAGTKRNEGVIAEDSSSGAEQVSADGQTLSAQSAAPVQTKPMGVGPSGMMLERPVATTKDEQDNVKELVRQAQVAVRKGGGEIKMDLKPEGMGQVHLKVSVDGGQVSVQMLTQNDEAKRLLEKGLHELKANLAAHQLKVDNVKVDVGSEIQKHFEKGPDDQAREQTRQFASDVMSQMRGERQAFQQGFMENRGWRQYPRGLDRETVQPAMVAEAAATKRGEPGKRANSSRLDLVA